MKIIPHLDSCVEIMFKILDCNTFCTELKTIAIVIIGDLCLVSESAFQPYFQRAMQALKAAAMEAIKQTDLRLMGTDGVRAVQLLRKSLVEAFMSMINGIKSPGDENQN